MSRHILDAATSWRLPNTGTCPSSNPPHPPPRHLLAAAKSSRPPDPRNCRILDAAKSPTPLNHRRCPILAAAKSSHLPNPQRCQILVPDKSSELSDPRRRQIIEIAKSSRPLNPRGYLHAATSSKLPGLQIFTVDNSSKSSNPHENIQMEQKSREKPGFEAVRGSDPGVASSWFPYCSVELVGGVGVLVCCCCGRSV